MLIQTTFQVKIGHTRLVIEYFDAISYEKRSAVSHMLQDYLGHNLFYIKKSSNYSERIQLREINTS